MRKDNEPLISTYGKRENAPAMAVYNRGATTRQEVQDSLDRRDASNKAKPGNSYSER
jgi:hypothetical protein